MAADNESADPEEDAFGRWLEATGQSHLLEGPDEEATKAAFMRLFVEWTRTPEGELELDKYSEQAMEQYGIGPGDDPAPPLQVLDGEDAEEVAFIRSLYGDEGHKDRMVVTDNQGRIIELAIYTFIHQSGPTIDESLRRLSGLRHVLSATIGCDLGEPETRKPLPADTLMPMAGWGQLQDLDIDLKDMGAQALLNLGAQNPFKKLREIKIRVKADADVAMKALRSAADLRRLTMQNSDLSDDGLRCLRIADKLEELILINTQVTGVGFDDLACVESLKNVTLEDCPISDEGLREISRFTRLEELYLGGSEVTDAGLEHLGRLSRLRRLALPRNLVTVNGFEVLLEHKQLETLFLSDLQLGDEIIPVLEQMKWLKMLYVLQETNITPTGFARLRKALPHCDIDQ